MFLQQIIKYMFHRLFGLAKIFLLGGKLSFQIFLHGKFFCLRYIFMCSSYSDSYCT